MQRKGEGQPPKSFPFRKPIANRPGGVSPRTESPGPVEDGIKLIALVKRGCDNDLPSGAAKETDAMPRTLHLAWVVPAVVITAQAAVGAAQHPETAKPDNGEYVSMRGCVHGSLLTSIRLDPATVSGSLTGSNRYRLVGSKEIRHQIKKADGRMVDVTGHLRVEDNRAFVKSKKSGKTTITVGGAQGMQEPLEDKPITDATLEVVGVEIVQSVCNKL